MKTAKKRGGASYPCPVCETPTQVRTTRLKPEGVVRNRECTKRSCGHIFDTMEVLPPKKRSR